MVQLLDGMTYAEVWLGSIIFTSCMFRFCVTIWSPTLVLTAKKSLTFLLKNYPFVETEKRVTVLKWLCDFFLHTPVFKQLISSDGHMDVKSLCAVILLIWVHFSPERFAEAVASPEKWFFATDARRVIMQTVLNCKKCRKVNGFAPFVKCISRAMPSIPRPWLQQWRNIDTAFHVWATIDTVEYTGSLPGAYSCKLFECVHPNCIL